MSYVTRAGVEEIKDLPAKTPSEIQVDIIITDLITDHNWDYAGKALKFLCAEMYNQGYDDCLKPKGGKVKDELYIILADYSNDLGALKQRNGKLPADAAVERIQALLIDELKLVWNKTQPDIVPEGWKPETPAKYIHKRIAELEGEK